MDGGEILFFKVVCLLDGWLVEEKWMVEVGNLKEIRDGKGGIGTGGIIFIERGRESLELEHFFWIHKSHH